MKTIKLFLISVVMVMLIAVIALADDNLGHADNIFFVETPTRSQEPTAVTCDPNTATLVLSTTTTRLEIRIKHLSGATSTVYYSTWPATSKAGLYPIPVNSVYVDDTNVWPGPVYILTEPGAASETVYVIEKYR